MIEKGDESSRNVRLSGGTVWRGRIPWCLTWFDWPDLSREPPLALRSASPVCRPCLRAPRASFETYAQPRHQLATRLLRHVGRSSGRGAGRSSQLWVGVLWRLLHGNTAGRSGVPCGNCEGSPLQVQRSCHPRGRPTHATRCPRCGHAKHRMLALTTPRPLARQVHWLMPDAGCSCLLTRHVLVELGPAIAAPACWGALGRSHVRASEFSSRRLAGWAVCSLPRRGHARVCAVVRKSLKVVPCELLAARDDRVDRCAAQETSETANGTTRDLVQPARLRPDKFVSWV